MTLKIIILYLIILLVLTYLVNSVFRLNKTVYILMYAVLVFIFVSFYLIYLGFEFLALSFFITYVGGIAVMFIFLIIVLNVKLENSLEIKKPLYKNYFYLILLNLVLVIAFSILLFLTYNYEMFNTHEFVHSGVIYEFYDNNFIFFSTFFDKATLYNFYPLIHRGDSLYKLNFFLNKPIDSIIISEFNNLHSAYSDVFILGVFLYKEHYLLLISIAFFLFIAIILACSISSTRANRLKRW